MHGCFPAYPRRERFFLEQLHEIYPPPSDARRLTFTRGVSRFSVMGVDKRGTSPAAGSIRQIKNLLVYLRKEEPLPLSAVKGYGSALNLVASLRGMDFALSCEPSMLMRNSSKSCSPQEVRPPE